MRPTVDANKFTNFVILHKDHPNNAVVLVHSLELQIGYFDLKIDSFFADYKLDVFESITTRQFIPTFWYLYWLEAHTSHGASMRLNFAAIIDHHRLVILIVFERWVPSELKPF